jgi:2-ketocyclohexanecarboxyl-CoA hydrolase
MAYNDIIYTKQNGVARVTINREKVMNAFRSDTVEEMILALRDADADPSIGVIVLAGAGERAFCTGGDQSTHDGKYPGRGVAGLPIEDLHTLIRDSRVPVIARVQGYAIGGGNVFATMCDITIASEKAIFGQVGPKVGSVDPGWGTAYLARVVGEKKAREMWYFCRRYSAAEALAMGLVNIVVSHDQLDATVDAWCAELMEKSPTALAIAKRSFNADSDNIRGIGNSGLEALGLFYQTAESKEGANAFREKRKPDFRGVRNREE